MLWSPPAVDGCSGSCLPRKGKENGINFHHLTIANHRNRAYGIQRNRPLTLQATINLPTVNDDMTDPMPHQLNGFVVMSNLFKPFDDAFNSIWSKARANLSPQLTASLQKQLTENVQSYLCQDSNFTDMHTNQQWLKSTIWQLTNGTVNGGTDDALSYQYPRDLLMSMASQFQFPHQGIELMNAGLVSCH